MPRQRLTLPRISAFNPKTESILWDEDMPRLGVRARPSGSKTFLFKGTLDYKNVRVTIGSTDSWTIEAARDEARRYQRWIDEGDDPRAVLQAEAKRKSEQEEAARAAIEAGRRETERKSTPALVAWNTYIDARRAKWGALSLRDHERISQEGGRHITRGKRNTEDGTTQPGVLRTLLLLPLVEIDAAAVQAWLADEAAKRPTQAALAFRLLRGFLNWCAARSEYRDQVQPDVCASKEVREELPKRVSKDDCLQREQLPLWFEHVRKLANPMHGAYLQVLLLTGARREELAGLRWEDVDFQWMSLTIKDKVEGERVIPLTPYVATLLRDLKARNETPPKKPRRLRQTEGEIASAWEPSPWVFSSPTAASGRLQEPRIGHNKALTAAGLPGLTLHGLRRSFGTLSEWCEVPVGVVAQIMGHKPSAIAEKHYRRRPLDLLRMWHVRIESWMLTEAGIEQPEERTAALKVIV